MKQLMRHYGGRMFAAGFALGAVVFALVGFSPGQGKTGLSREILLTTHGVAFYLPDRPNEPNPTIALKKGETVKLTLRNDEPGKILHCFRVGGLKVKTTEDLATGESEVLTFTPKQAGTFPYACLMHAGMAGKIVVK
jgi:plastocyanin